MPWVVGIQQWSRFATATSTDDELLCTRRCVEQSESELCKFFARIAQKLNMSWCRECLRAKMQENIGNHPCSLDS